MSAVADRVHTRANSRTQVNARGRKNTRATKKSKSAGKRKSKRKPEEPQGLLFSEFGWGGKREGAGAKPRIGAGVPHDRRQPFKNLPVHVTMKFRDDLNGLRHAAESEVVRKALREVLASKFGEDVRWMQYSIQWDHVHLIAVAKNEAALTAALQSLTIRIAKALNRLWNRKGPVYTDRYHVHVLKGPYEVREALRYVLNNARKHRLRVPDGPDPLSSGKSFREWLDVSPLAAEPDPCIEEPRHWLLREGWQKHCPRFSTEDAPEDRRPTAGDRKRERRLRRRSA